MEQVRLGLDSSQPLAVQQWNSLIAINYAARKFDVKRMDTIETARQKCPQIRFVHVQTIDEHGTVMNYDGEQPPQNIQSTLKTHKVSLARYRRESNKIMTVLQRFALTQRASIDEAYLDLTEATNQKYLELKKVIESNQFQNNPSFQWEGVVLGGKFDPQTESDMRLLVASQLVTKIRETVFHELNYTCSAGIAPSKKFAKAVAGMNKPNQHTILPQHFLPTLLQTFPLKKIQVLCLSVLSVLSVCLSCLSCLSVCLVCLSVLSVLSVLSCLSGLSVYLSVCLSVCLLFVFLSLYSIDVDSFWLSLVMPLM